jgi:hypothetical protein
MSARQLSQLQYALEEVHEDEQDVHAACELYQIPLDPYLVTMLDSLVNPQRDRDSFLAASQLVQDKQTLPHFWRALAALHQGYAAEPAAEWPGCPDAYYARALSIMSWVWTLPNSTDKHAVNPDASYIYHARMRARARVSIKWQGLGMEVLGTEAAIKEGWFEAPSLVAETCTKLIADADLDQAKWFAASLMARSQEPHCYHSRIQRAKFLQAHSTLLAA